MRPENLNPVKQHQDVETQVSSQARHSSGQCSRQQQNEDDDQNRSGHGPSDFLHLMDHEDGMAFQVFALSWSPPLEKPDNYDNQGHDQQDVN